MSLVLDASMAVTWLFEDEHSAASHRVLQRVADEGAFVPSLWRQEVANVLRNAVRRDRCSDAYADESLARLGCLPIEADEETFTRAWTHTWQLSREQDLSVYDAAYLEVAVRRALPLASCDGALLAAARRLQLKVFTNHK